MTMTANERIRAARERAGLEHGDMASKLGISYEEYWDIEGFEEDVWCCHSFDTLHRLAQALGLTLLEILEGDDCVGPVEPMSFADFRSAVAESVRASGGNADAWGERAGWDVGPLLRDPEAFWNMCPDELRDVGHAAGVDWRGVLPE
jgi:transcriptional regulator with XRE-family HTH domain